MMGSCSRCASVPPDMSAVSVVSMGFGLTWWLVSISCGSPGILVSTSVP